MNYAISLGIGLSIAIIVRVAFHVYVERRCRKRGHIWLNVKDSFVCALCGKQLHDGNEL